MHAVRRIIMGLLGTFLLVTVAPMAVSQERRSISPPTGTPERPIGVAAISVRPGTSPPFSAEDVSKYLNAHKLPKIFDLPGQVTVNSLEFMNSAELSRRLHGVTTGLDDDDLVGLATFSGNLIVSGPPGREPAEFSRGYAVFSAATGNLLFVGTS